MTKKLGNSEILRRLKDIHGDLYDLSRVTAEHKEQSVEIGCKIHGFVTTNVGNLLRGQKGCVYCKGKNISLAKRKAAQPAIRKAIVENRFPHITYDLDTFTTWLSPMRMVCEKHGDFWQLPFNHFKPISLGGCPSCNAGRHSSTIEDNLAEFVSSLGFEVKRGRRDVIKPREIDIWVPEKNVGVELHGLYYHSDDPVGTRLKRELAEKASIRLIQIFEDEWENQRAIVEDLIRAAFGLRDTVYARKTEIKEITHGESIEFLETHHIQGGAKSRHQYGLTFEDKLVAVLTLAKSRFNSEADYEIVRFATSCNVVGGFQKLFSYFTREVSPTSVMTYADLRLGTGAIYEKSGFTAYGVTPPSYWWWKPRCERIPRYRTQKHVLKGSVLFKDYFDESKTENQICRDAGFVQIFDAGHKKFIWRR